MKPPQGYEGSHYITVYRRNTDDRFGGYHYSGVGSLAEHREILARIRKDKECTKIQEFWGVDDTFQDRVFTYVSELDPNVDIHGISLRTVLETRSSSELEAAANEAPVDSE